MNNIIEVRNLSFRYTPDREVIRQLSLAVRAGDFLSIIGPNGAGKSTLLSLLSGDLRPAAGSIKIDGTALESYNRQDLAQRIALVRQEFMPAFGFSAVETIAMARIPHYGRFGFPHASDRTRIEKAMDFTETTHLADRPITSLSGGERQRVFIARALAQDTPILLLDEPTNFLDPRHQVGIYDLLKMIQAEHGKTIIAVTHEINLVARYSDRVLVLGPEREHQFGRTDAVMTANVLEQAFGVNLEVGTAGNRTFFVPVGRHAVIGKSAAPGDQSLHRGDAPNNA